MTEQLVAPHWRAETAAFLVRHRAARAVDLADRLVDTIERDHPAYRRSGLVSHVDLETFCRANVAAILDLVVATFSDGPPHLDGPAYEPARATGVRRAQQGLPLDDVLRSFRIGGRLIWDDLVEAGADRLEGPGMRELGSVLWSVVDETSAQVATAYHDHERSRVRDDEQRRASLWEDLLGGRARDPGFAIDAADLLDLPPFGSLLVVIAEGLDPATVEAAVTPHAWASTWRGDLVVGVLPLREDRPDAAYDALERLVPASGSGRPAGDAARRRVTVSAVVEGLAAVGEGYRQARAVSRSASATQPFVRYDAMLPEVLLLTVPDVSARLLARWIEPLRALGEEGEVLLGTLSAWVASGGSASRAARRVPCHRNTVLNRLHRVSQVTGLPLDDDAPPLDLDLALRASALRP